jgi:hypothetical protein
MHIHVNGPRHIPVKACTPSSNRRRLAETMRRRWSWTGRGILDFVAMSSATVRYVDEDFHIIEDKSGDFFVYSGPVVSRHLDI